MRPGLPSDAAREAQAGLWIVQTGDLAMHVGGFGTKEERPAFLEDFHETWWFPEECANWRFWPCDAHGNKVRWPERDGVML